MKILLKVFLCLGLALLFMACERPKRHIDRAFYHWQAEGYGFYGQQVKFLDTLGIKKIYVRFFDVSYNEVQGPVPVGELSYLGSGSTQGREITGEPITG
jgi:hypothetical protein